MSDEQRDSTASRDPQAELTSPQSPTGPDAPPLFEPAIHRRLAPGELGLITARAGVGKTCCLIQFGLAELLAGRPALHVALDMTVAQVRARYDRLLGEAGRLGHAAADPETALKVAQLRHIHRYQGHGFRPERLTDALTLMQEVMDFRPALVALDGYLLDPAEPEALADLARVAAEHRVAIWLTALAHRDAPRDPQSGLPEPLACFASALQVILELVPEEQQIRLHVLKDHDDPAAGPVPRPLPLYLDPSSQLLISG